MAWSDSSHHAMIVVVVHGDVRVVGLIWVILIWESSNRVVDSVLPYESGHWRREVIVLLKSKLNREGGRDFWEGKRWGTGAISGCHLCVLVSFISAPDLKIISGPAGSDVKSSDLIKCQVSTLQIPSTTLWVQAPLPCTATLREV